MIAAILGGFTILGVFLTFTAWLNGRSTKKFIREMNESTQRLIVEESQATKEMIDKIDQRAQQRHEELIPLMKS